jgi:carboxyl-terminal processing protease
VYDGKGIAPDVALSAQNYSEISQTLIEKYLIFDFATQYFIDNEKIADARSFKLSEAEYSNFLKFIADKDYAYETESEKILNKYKEKANEEKYFDDVVQQFEAMKTQLAAAKANDLQTHKTEIKKLIEEEIVSRYYFQKGRVQNRLYADNEIAQAQKVLANAAQYKKILALD